MAGRVYVKRRLDILYELLEKNKSLRRSSRKNKSSLLEDRIARTKKPRTLATFTYPIKIEIREPHFSRFTRFAHLMSKR